MTDRKYNFPVMVGVETGQGPTLMECARRIYSRSSVGCCLHILLDDGNTEDSHAQFCVDYALEQDGQEHLDCINVAMCLKHMTVAQRDDFRAELHGYEPRPAAAGGDHPDGDRPDVARLDEVTRG